ncbi:hypothetical protein GLOIN_2v1483195 [Rhizophagus clarus]|uniref:Uncharacterized protein n=1 Tax=Rhizophagus clarus TaxID=94130 RepID=A0A8H3L0R9_9GLOM|nr:hypothetical protein GLOIN_2v1483195 [Rhizophagus clarus]
MVRKIKNTSDNVPEIVFTLVPPFEEQGQDYKNSQTKQRNKNSNKTHKKRKSKEQEQIRIPQIIVTDLSDDSDDLQDKGLTISNSNKKFPKNIINVEDNDHFVDFDFTINEFNNKTNQQENLFKEKGEPFINKNLLLNDPSSKNLKTNQLWKFLKRKFMTKVISLSFLYYRVKIKGQSIFFPATRERGLIRPRPQDSFHIAVGVFNFSQMIVLILLITESFPNVTFAEIIINIPKLLGFACAVLYPISIIYSTPILKQTSYSLKVQWNPNKFFIDGLAIYLMLGPLLTIIPLTALTGHFAERHNYFKAEYIFMIQALGYIIILQRRRNENSGADSKIKKLENASHNLSWIVAAVFLMFSISSLEGILIGFKYKEDKMATNKYICQMYYFISWNFTIPVLTFIGQMIFLYDTLKSKKSTQLQHSNTYDPVNNIPSRLKQNSSHLIRGINHNKEISSSFRSIQKSKSNKSTLTNISSTTTKKNNSMSAEVKTSLLSTIATGVSSLISKSSDFDKSKINIRDDSDFSYYFENDEDGNNIIIKNVPDVVVSSDKRKSWLIKKPVRSAITVNKDLLSQDH